MRKFAILFWCLFAIAFSVSAADATIKVLPTSTTNVASIKLLPGPSDYLFNHPYYACLNNRYVSTSGSDSNDGASAATAWATLQHANNASLGAGSCINVEPGTYSSGVLISNGGNYASSKGYLVYRCTKIDACTVTDVSAGGQNGSFAWDYSNLYTVPATPMGGNYVIIDGFRMAAASQTLYGQGIQVYDGPNETNSNAAFSVHHIWVLNSVISGYGQSGVQMNDGEYFFTVHNTVYNNSSSGCGAQGSGISYVTAKALSGYTRSHDDSNNPILGKIGNFNNAVEYNVVFNNAITNCGTPSNAYDTDGNNIIMDTFNNGGSTNVIYPNYTLISYNVSYNAGGRGIHATSSGNLVVANNSCYNSSLDPSDNGTYRPCIGELNGYNDLYINNISYGIAGSGFNAYNNAFNMGMPSSPTGNVTAATTNISYCSGSSPYGCVALFASGGLKVDPTFYSQVTTGDAATFATSGSLPSPLNTSNTFYLAKIGNNNIAVASSQSNAISGSYQNIYNSGSGTITINDTTNGHVSSTALNLMPTFICTGTNANKCSVNPLWVNVGNSSQGTETTQPSGANFALQTGSPAIGAGQTKSYLPPESVDIGACPHSLTVCPKPSSQP